MNLLLKIAILLMIPMSIMAQSTTEMMPGTLDCSKETSDALKSCITNNMVVCIKHGLNETECAGMLNSDGNIMIKKSPS